MTSPTPPPGAPRDHLAEARAAFNRGEFHLAHEHWEEVWRRSPGSPTSVALASAVASPAPDDSPGSDRRILQGLIQIAAGCHHLTHGRTGPGTRLLRKGAAKLGTVTTAFAPACSPALATLPWPRFLADVASLLTTLSAASTNATAAADPTSLKL